MSAELVQTNFKLTTEVKQLRAEVASMKARRAIEVAEEVARIKSAYELIEEEVVALRQESVRLKYSEVVECSPGEPELQDASGVVSMLSEQLDEERARYTILEQRYRDLRKEFQESSIKSVSYSESSTCVGSPVYLASQLSLERGGLVVLKPAEFTPPLATRRTLPVLADALPVPSSSVPPVEPKKRTKDHSIQRLSKIARFRS